MKRIVMMIFFSIIFTVNAQIKIDNARDFQVFIYDCLDSLRTRNLDKYQEIRAIKVSTDSKGKITSYIIYFTCKDIQLSKKEYKWLFNLLKQRNYLGCVKIFYSDKELELRKKFYLSIKFVPKEKRDHISDW